MISFQDNIRAFERGLSDLARRQLPFATSQALNDTAFDVKDAWETLFDKRLDKPTPFTKRGVFIRRSTKSKLVAEVGIKDIQAGYLKTLVAGGERTPSGRAILIPVGQKLNKYGNMPKGSVARALSRKDTFSGRVKGVAGVWKRPTKSKRKSSGPVLLVAYADRADYDQQLDLDHVAAARARARFPIHFEKRFMAAMQTAR